MYTRLCAHVVQHLVATTRCCTTCTGTNTVRVADPVAAEEADTVAEVSFSGGYRVLGRELNLR